MKDSKRIALLIDCDNISHNSIKGVLEELAKYGTVNIRHAHGDWNSKSLSGWIHELHPYAIRPMQQFAYTKGKNATDSAMIIDAMDLLYAGNVDAFAIVSSDSDFTPLVLRILENGFPVYGFGAKKTPKPFVDACSPFIYTENLTLEHEKESEASENKIKKDKKQLKQDTTLVKLLRTAVEQTSEDDGWALLNRVGLYISNNSSFSPRNYGYTKLVDLVEVSELFEIRFAEDKSTVSIKDVRKNL